MTEGGPDTSVITCPLPECGWRYVIPPLDPRALQPGTLAEVFGAGVFASVAANRRARDVEDTVAAHLQGHTVEQYVRALTRAQQHGHELTGYLVRIADLIGRDGTSPESVVDRVAYLAEQHATTEAAPSSTSLRLVEPDVRVEHDATDGTEIELNGGPDGTWTHTVTVLLRGDAVYDLRDELNVTTADGEVR